MLACVSKAFASTKNAFRAATHCLPAPGKINKSGEDAYFVSDQVLAIADGVGGWASYNVDSSKYSWALMHRIEAQVKQGQTAVPQDILRASAAGISEIGSSTCCLVALDDSQPELRSGNIGDSGFFLLRLVEGKLKLVHKCELTVHGFNFPRQLGTNGDSVDKGAYESVKVKHKDLLVLFTDGLSDNLFDEQVVAIAEPLLGDLGQIAKTLAEAAKQSSANKAWQSPFAQAAKQAGYRWAGGKPDDITVIAAEVVLYQ